MLIAVVWIIIGMSVLVLIVGSGEIFSKNKELVERIKALEASSVEEEKYRLREANLERCVQMKQAEIDRLQKFFRMYPFHFGLEQVQGAFHHFGGGSSTLIKAYGCKWLGIEKDYPIFANEGYVSHEMLTMHKEEGSELIFAVSEDVLMKMISVMLKNDPTLYGLPKNH